MTRKELEGVEIHTVDERRIGHIEEPFVAVFLKPETARRWAWVLEQRVESEAFCSSGDSDVLKFKAEAAALREAAGEPSAFLPPLHVSREGGRCAACEKAGVPLEEQDAAHRRLANPRAEAAGEREEESDG